MVDEYQSLIRDSLIRQFLFALSQNEEYFIGLLRNGPTMIGKNDQQILELVRDSIIEDPYPFMIFCQKLDLQKQGLL